MQVDNRYVEVDDVMWMCFEAGGDGQLAGRKNVDVSRGQSRRD